MHSQSIQRTGELLASDKDGLLVSVPRSTPCGACKNREVCPSGILGAASQHTVRIPGALAHEAIEPGSAVQLLLPRAGLGRLVAIAYLVPALCMVAGAGACSVLWPGVDAPAVIGAIVGLGMGCALLRLYDAHATSTRWLPHIRLVRMGRQAETGRRAVTE